MLLRGFLSADVKDLLKNKFVVLIGDSVQRSAYKDLVQLLHSSHLVQREQLKTKGELTFLNDKLIEGGSRGTLHNGVGYREEREYKTDLYFVQFYFVTRCYNKYVESILQKLTKEDQPTPDIIVMSSCIWDITRYGPNSMQLYHKNLNCLFNRFNEVLSKDTLVVWTTQSPVDQTAKGGFMRPEVAFLYANLHRAILMGNRYAHQVATKHGYGVLDLYYFLKKMTHHQEDDGVHWKPEAHRHISNLILTHIAEALGCRLLQLVQPFMDPQSHVYGIPHPDRRLTSGDISCLHMPHKFPHWYHMAPSTIPATLVPHTYMGPQSHHGHPVNWYDTRTWSGTRPQFCYTGALNCCRYIGVSRNYHCISRGHRYFNVD